MRSLKSQLPSLNALLTFESAARHLSFTEAAHELCVSQAAVSRQIRALEEQLGTSLFHRHHRGLALTEDGRQMHQAATTGFEHIANVVRTIDQGQRRGRIRVATTVAFATYWFAPRLGEFRCRYPHVDVRLLASDRQQDHLTDSVDIAMICGQRDVTGWTMTPLFSEVVFPVCSRAYLEKKPIRNLRDLPGHTLLHLDDRHWEDIGWDPVDWSVWLSKFGVHYEPSHPIITFNNYPMLVEAALAGEGIALGWRHLSENLLAQHRLVRPLAQEWDFERYYYLACCDQATRSAELLALGEWLLND